MIFDALWNAVYPVSLRVPGAELEGGSQKQQNHQVVENLEAQQGAGIDRFVDETPIGRGVDCSEAYSTLGSDG